MNIITQDIAQQIVDTVKDVSNQNINFIDDKGIIIASTDTTRINTFHEIGYQVVTTGHTIEVSNDDNFWVQKRNQYSYYIWQYHYCCDRNQRRKWKK